MAFLKASLLCAVLFIITNPVTTGPVSGTHSNKLLDIIHRLLKIAGHGHYGLFVAFDVQLTHTFTARRTGDIVTYNKINVNIGDAYRRGEFTCPLDGVYEFVWMTMCPANKNCYHYLQLNNSSKRMVYAYERTGKSYLHTTTSQILHLKRGDKVTIRMNSGHQLYGSSSYGSNFEGKLLYAD